MFYLVLYVHWSYFLWIVNSYCLDILHWIAYFLIDMFFTYNVYYPFVFDTYCKYFLLCVISGACLQGL